jgi:prepilin-type N-terminal cleavage/methylation domain-containing protein
MRARDRQPGVDPDHPAGEMPPQGRRRRRRLLRRQRGLTLVELMVVVTIIAIVAAVAMAVYQDITRKAKLAADQGIVASLRSAVAIYYGRSNGLFPGSLGNVETLVTPVPTYNCSVPPTYDTGNGKITFTATLGDC